MRYFPIFVDLRAKRVAVIGGTEEALRKVRLLIKSEARIDVISGSLHPELRELWLAGRVSWILDAFEPVMLQGAALVYSADADLNASVSAAAQALGIPVNAVDQADISTFLVPSIVDRDPVVIAIGTEGTAPVLGQGIRARIDAMLPQTLGKLAAAANALRPRVAETVPHGNRRRSFWQSFFFGPAQDAFLASDDTAFDREVEIALEGAARPAAGRVSFVSVGSGDPELLTIKAHRRLLEADLIVHDLAVNGAFLEMARRDAVRLAAEDAAKADGGIVALLAEETRAGRHVTRMIVGGIERATAELAALAAAGVITEIVPAIVSAQVFPFPVREDLRDAILRAAS